MPEGINVLAMLLIAAFAIERITSGILFLLQFFRALPDPDTVETSGGGQVKQKIALWRFGIASCLTILLLLIVPDFSFLGAMGINANLPHVLDRILLGVVLVGGSERMSAFLRMLGAPGLDSGDAAAQSVEVSGELTLKEPLEKTRLAGR